MAEDRYNIPSHLQHENRPVLEEHGEAERKLIGLDGVEVNGSPVKVLDVSKGVPTHLFVKYGDGRMAWVLPRKIVRPTPPEQAPTVVATSQSENPRLAQPE